MIVDLSERELLDLQLVIDAYLIEYGSVMEPQARKERYQALFNRLEKVCFSEQSETVPEYDS